MQVNRKINPQILRLKLTILNMGRGYEGIKLGLSLASPPLKAYLCNLFCPLAGLVAGISLIINNLKDPWQKF
jgi:hypothetical protein